MPSFCLTDTHPHPDVPEASSAGFSRIASPRREDLLHCGGSYDSEYSIRIA